jgi:hypothetical protein
MNAQQAWQSQTTEAPRISLDYVRHRTQSFERRARWRNAAEYAFATFGFCYFCWHAWFSLASKPLFAAALVWSALYCVYGAIQWHRKARVQAAPADAGVFDTLQYQRRHLERQRDARARSWRWWLPPALPGFGLLIASLAIESPSGVDARFWLLVAWIVFAMAAGIWIYERDARRLQREIDALDSLARG